MVYEIMKKPALVLLLAAVLMSQGCSRMKEIRVISCRPESVSVQGLRGIHAEASVEVDNPARTRRAAKASAILLPEKIPVRIPMRVMPIWTADRNLSGSDESFSAVFAALLPLLASACRLDFLAEITAISDMAKIPFRRIRNIMMNISLI